MDVEHRDGGVGLWIRSDFAGDATGSPAKMDALS
jgi:hypothetical protein